MTTDGPGSDDGGDEPNFVRPSLTLRERHSDLLDELHTARYGSRSEAARAAIESLANSVLSNGETGREQVLKEVNQLKVQVNELADQIDETQKQQPAGDPADSPSQLRDDDSSTPDSPTVESTETQGSAELRHTVYELLSEHGEMSVPEIAEHVEEDPFDIHQNIEQLIENHGFVKCTEQSNVPRYSIRKPNSD